MVSTAASHPDSTAAPRAPGRPREQRIDDAVLDATAALLQEVGYARLSIAAVAARAGTHKPAIYRRWPSKAQLVHEAAFPTRDTALVPDTGDLRHDVAAMVRGAAELFARPVVRAAVPGLIAEFASDPDLHALLLQRLSEQVWGALRDRVATSTDRGELRPGVDPSVLLELVGGAALLAALTRGPDELGEDWVQCTVSILMEGIAP